MGQIEMSIKTIDSNPEIAPFPLPGTSKKEWEGTRNFSITYILNLIMSKYQHYQYPKIGIIWGFPLYLQYRIDQKNMLWLEV